MSRKLLTFIILFLFFMGIRTESPAQNFRRTFADKPEYVVMFVIDGISYKVWDKMELPTMKEMIANGVLADKVYLPPAAHPVSGIYAELHTCSIPNPIMMAGTVFIDRDTEYIEEMFPREKTAFVANTRAYYSISGNYGHVYQQGGEDETSVEVALDFMEQHRPTFVRVHLQNPGGAGAASMSAEDGVEWQYNIWADNSPYRKLIAESDALLRQFIEGLEKLGILERTAIFVLGDHGQDDTGWHPLELIDSSITTMVIWGAGINQGARIPYSELMDLVPTICHLMEVETPSTSQGRILGEALQNYTGPMVPPEENIRIMLEQFDQYRAKTAEAAWLLENMQSGRRGQLYSAMNRQVIERFYDIRRFVEWTRFEAVEELNTNNASVLLELDKLLEEIRKTR